MADKRFRTYVKMLITLTCVFVASRSPVDIIQLKGLIDAARGFHLKDPFEIEYEIVLIWVTYIPLVLNPVIYFSFLSEYRRGTVRVLATCCGCRVRIRAQVHNFEQDFRGIFFCRTTKPSPRGTRRMRLSTLRPKSTTRRLQSPTYCK